MRKRLIDRREPTAGWLDLEAPAEGERSSEDPSHPIEFALTGREGGWQAAEIGEQVIRQQFTFSPPGTPTRV